MHPVEGHGNQSVLALWLSRFELAPEIKSVNGLAPRWTSGNRANTPELGNSHYNWREYPQAQRNWEP